ncbi:hypothetical protein XHC_3268 [Xanthomonas hortorum pv. carotae str. M081]|nr:hypothetical protein XHC_3268 [Xanthomonas hortorum pv. carotae str. M081]
MVPNRALRHSQRGWSLAAATRQNRAMKTAGVAGRRLRAQ